MMTFDLFSRLEADEPPRGRAAARREQPRCVPVMVPMPADRAYSYSVPEGMRVVPGAVVRVPLGPRQVAGVVWDGPGEAVDPRKLRAILQVFDCPPIDEPMRRFVDWIAAYTLAPPGLVARMLLRAPEAFDPEPPTEGLVRAAGRVVGRMTPARARVLALAEEGRQWTRSGLVHAAGVSASVIDGLAGAGVLEKILLPPLPIVPPPDPGFAAPKLNGSQAQVAEALREAVGRTASPSR